MLKTRTTVRVGFVERALFALQTWVQRLKVIAADVVRAEQGQGTTEYAILVGVLVVIAIIAIVAFRGRVQELWTSIADAINGL